MERAKNSGGLAAVVLAAGLSRRLGFPKQLCSFEGQTLLERALFCLQQPILDLEGVYLVTGAARDACWTLAQAALPSALEIFNPDYPSGLASSISCAARHLSSLNEGPAALLFLACDQLFLSPEQLVRLVSSSREGLDSGYRLAASSYQEAVGIPAIFPRLYWNELARLTAGDQGAKAILKAADDLLRVPFPQGEIDIDTPEEMQRFSIRFDAGRFAQPSR